MPGPFSSLFPIALQNDLRSQPASRAFLSCSREPRSEPTFRPVVHLSSKVGNAEPGVMDVLGLQEGLVVGMDTVQFLQHGGIRPLGEHRHLWAEVQSPATGQRGTHRAQGLPPAKATAQNDPRLPTDRKLTLRGRGLSHEPGRAWADTGSATLHCQLSDSTLPTMVQAPSLASGSLDEELLLTASERRLPRDRQVSPGTGRSPQGQAGFPSLSQLRPCPQVPRRPPWALLSLTND